MSAQEKLVVLEDLDRSVLKKEPRSACVLANFCDGYAAGWAFRVPESAAGALDIQRSVIRRGGRSFSCWTQGRAFDVAEGTVFYLDDAGLQVQVDYAESAGYVPSGALDIAGASYSDGYGGSVVRGQGDVHVGYLAYDPGRVNFSVYVLQEGGWGKVAEYSCSQVEFVGMLQTGELVTKQGVVAISDVHLDGCSHGDVCDAKDNLGADAVSLSRALKYYEVDIGPGVASAVLTGAGVLREVSRWSDSRGGEKRYKVFTEAGGFYGYDKAPRGIPESQPMYYLARFGVLVDLIKRFMAGDAALSVWAGVGGEGVRVDGCLAGLYQRSHTGSEEWYTNRVAAWRERFGVPVANSLHLVKALELEGSVSLVFWEYDRHHDLLARYSVTGQGAIGDLELDDVDYSREEVGWA